MSLSDTRWLVISDCVERILKQYDALTAHFDIVNTNGKDYDARILFDMFRDEQNRSLLLFLFPMLRDLSRLTKLFQRKQANNLVIYNEIQVFFMDLARKILKDSTLRNSTVQQLCEINLSTTFCFLSLNDVTFGEVFMQSIRKFDVDTQNNLKNRAQAFMKQLFVQLQARLTGTLQTIRKLEPFCLPRFYENPPTIREFMKPFFMTDMVSLGILENHVRQLVPLVKENDTTDSFWINIHNLKIGEEPKYQEISNGVVKMLCIPISNAEVERTFSAASYFKSWRRSGIKIDLLEAMLYCKFGLIWMGKSLSNFIPPINILSYDASQLYD